MTEREEWLALGGLSKIDEIYGNATVSYHHHQIDEDSDAIIQPTNGFINGNHSREAHLHQKCGKHRSQAIA